MEIQIVTTVRSTSERIGKINRTINSRLDSRVEHRLPAIILFIRSLWTGDLSARDLIQANKRKYDQIGIEFLHFLRWKIWSLMWSCLWHILFLISCSRLENIFWKNSCSKFSNEELKCEEWSYNYSLIRLLWSLIPQGNKWDRVWKRMRYISNRGKYFHEKQEASRLTGWILSYASISYPFRNEIYRGNVWSTRGIKIRW